MDEKADKFVRKKFGNMDDNKLAKRLKTNFGLELTPEQIHAFRMEQGYLTDDERYARTRRRLCIGIGSLLLGGGIVYYLQQDDEKPTDDVEKKTQVRATFLSRSEVLTASKALEDRLASGGEIVTLYPEYPDEMIREWMAYSEGGSRLLADIDKFAGDLTRRYWKETLKPRLNTARTLAKDCLTAGFEKAYTLYVHRDSGDVIMVMSPRIEHVVAKSIEDVVKGNGTMQQKKNVRYYLSKSIKLKEGEEEARGISQLYHDLWTLIEIGKASDPEKGLFITLATFLLRHSSDQFLLPQRLEVGGKKYELFGNLHSHNAVAGVAAHDLVLSRSLAVLFTDYKQQEESYNVHTLYDGELVSSRQLFTDSALRTWYLSSKYNIVVTENKLRNIDGMVELDLYHEAGFAWKLEVSKDGNHSISRLSGKRIVETLERKEIGDSTLYITETGSFCLVKGER